MTNVRVLRSKGGGYNVVLMVDGEKTKREWYVDRRSAIESARQWATLIGIEVTEEVEKICQGYSNDDHRELWDAIMSGGSR